MVKSELDQAIEVVENESYFNDDEKLQLTLCLTDNKEYLPLEVLKAKNPSDVRSVLLSILETNKHKPTVADYISSGFAMVQNYVASMWTKYCYLLAAYVIIGVFCYIEYTFYFQVQPIAHSAAPTPTLNRSRFHHLIINAGTTIFEYVIEYSPAICVYKLVHIFFQHEIFLQLSHHKKILVYVVLVILLNILNLFCPPAMYVRAIKLFSLYFASAAVELVFDDVFKLFNLCTQTIHTNRRAPLVPPTDDRWNNAV